MPAAARLADPISHTNAFGGLIAGAIIGGGLALLTVGTGGLAAVAIVGAATVAGASVGELLGSLSANLHVTGKIAPACSPNVSINRRPAARAHLDFVICADHSGRPPVAQGSDSVFVNNQPAPRVGDRAACDAVITGGSPNVFFGGGTITTDAISPEVPAIVHTAMLVVGLASAAVLAGPVVALVGLAGGIVGGKVAGDLGGAIFGEGSDGQKIMAFGGALLGGGLAGKGAARGEAWFDARYAIKQEGLGANFGNLRIVPRPQPVAGTPAAGTPAAGTVAPKLLPGEGKVGTYGDLVKAGSKGDNITGHHIPSANRMAAEGVAKNDGIAINMEQPSPGTGGRHRATFTYGRQADAGMAPRDALAAGVRDARGIYQRDGLYTPQIRSSLQEVIRMNRTNHPTIFKK